MPITDISDAGSRTASQEQEQEQEQRAPVADAQPHPALADNEIRLSGGRIVGMRRTTIDDGEEVMLLLQKMGYDMANLSPQTTGLHNALYAISSIDGTLKAPPRDAHEMKALRKQFSLGTDAQALATLYVRVQGLGGDFRGAE